MLTAHPQGRGRQVPAPPAPPTPPAPQTPPGSEHELHALAAKRGELAQQLESLTERREEVADQLHGAETAARPGLLGRLQALDERIVQLEQEILRADDAIAAGIASGMIAPPIETEETETTEQPPWDMDAFSEEAVSVIVGEALVFVLLGIILYQLGWRRARTRFSREAPDQSGRIDQLQNSVDAIAVEIERISEGQRYVSKVLNEGSQPEVIAGRGQEEAIPVRRKAT